jgi:hypothetical protein
VKQQRAEQVLEVEVIDGACQTFYYPSNQELLDQVAKRSAPHLYITRWVCFPGDIVPPEYAWAQPVPEKPGLAPGRCKECCGPNGWSSSNVREPLAPATPAPCMFYSRCDPGNAFCQSQTISF